MTLKRPTPDRLLLVDFPYLIGCAALPLSMGGFIVFVSFLLDSNHHRVREYLYPAVWTAMWFMALAVFAKRCAFDMDLSSRVLTWRRRGLIENSGGQLRFDEIRSVNIECIRSSSTRGSSSMRACYRLVLHTKAGDVIPLTRTYTGASDPVDYDEVRQELSKALGHPPTTVDDDIAELLKAKRQTDAIVLAREAYRLDYDEARRQVEALAAPDHATG